jgi:hypothetical protein
MKRSNNSLLSSHQIQVFDIEGDEPKMLSIPEETINMADDNDIVICDEVEVNQWFCSEPEIEYLLKICQSTSTSNKKCQSTSNNGHGLDHVSYIRNFVEAKPQSMNAGINSRRQKLRQIRRIVDTKACMTSDYSS